MKADEDDEIEVWLEEEWDGSVQWDDANRRKLTHGVLQVEIDALFAAPFVVLGRIVPPVGANWPPEERFLVLGKTTAGRFLTVIWTTRGDSIRPISMRSSTNAERKFAKNKIG